MAQRPTRSLKYEYELFVEQELENYKESVPRGVLLSVGDDAVKALSATPQLVLTELLLCDEVDRIIARRIRLPSYATWRKRRVKLIDELRRPEHWGLRPDNAVVRALTPWADGRVLFAGATDAVSPIYLAAHGCEVTTLSDEATALEQIEQAAIGAGLSGRVHTRHGGLATWIPAPDHSLDAVIVSPAALTGLSADERARVIDVLQSATTDGGVHLVQAIAASSRQADALSLDELRARYRGWTVTIERAEGRSKTFLARKGAA